MKFDKKDLLLYIVTDRSWLGQTPLENAVEASVRGGATFVQLREKKMENETFLALAKKVKAVTDRYHVPFVINDNVEVALACSADGIHVGQQDAPPEQLRALLGPDKILGVSASTVEEAIAAEKAGADYLGVGAVFSTSTKQDACDVPLSTLQKICASVSIPVVAIGGIGEQNLLQLKGSGIAGVAVVSAVFSQKDFYAASQRLRALCEKLVRP